MWDNGEKPVAENAEVLGTYAIISNSLLLLFPAFTEGI